MRSNHQFIKLFLVLFICTAFVFRFSHFGVLAFGKINKDSNVYSSGTSVGSLSIEGKTQNAAELIALISPSINKQEIEVGKFTDSLIETASALEPGQYSIRLNDYFQSNDNGESGIINEAVIKPKEVPEGMEELAADLASIEITAQSTFSLLEYMKKQKLGNSSNTALSIIASGIYKAVLPTNFSVIERNIGQELPGYTDLGYEAKIDRGKNFDLIISNPNEAKYLLELQWDGQFLTVFLKGEKFLFEYKTVTRDEQHFKPKTIKQYSPILLAGQTKIVQEGLAGSLINVYREVYKNGQLIDSVLISEDFYPPVHRVEIHALPVTLKQPDSTGTPDSSVQQNTGSGQTGNLNGSENSTSNNRNNSSNDHAGTAANESTDIQSPGTADDGLWGKPNEEPK